MRGSCSFFYRKTAYSALLYVFYGDCDTLFSQYKLIFITESLYFKHNSLLYYAHQLRKEELIEKESQAGIYQLEIF